MEKSFIFDSVLVDGVYDRQYLSSDFCNYFGSFIGNGVFPNPSTNLQVVANENLEVAVLAGKAFINGRTYHNTDKIVFPLDVADGVLNRIDTVVVQVNHLAREIKTVIKKGTFAVNPIPPELTNNADYEEIQLAKIAVNAGAIKITNADITDTRLNKDLCGIVHGTVDQVDTTTLFNQYRAWYEQETGKAVEDMEAFKTKFQEETSTLVNQYKTWYEQTTGNAVEDIDAFKAQFQSDLLVWFEGLKSILDDNAATNLLNLINEVKDGTYTKEQVDGKVTEATTAIDEVKDSTYTKAEMDTKLDAKAEKTQLEHTRTYPLNHSKSGTSHTFTGLPKQSGIYQCQFKAVADFTEGDTFAEYTAKPIGEDTTLPDKAFITGDLVSIVVDTESKRLGFKIGGGGSYGTLSPQIKQFTAKAGYHKIKLTWQNPTDQSFEGTYLVRKQGSAPQKLSDGKKIDVGKATSYTDNETENDKLYYYRAFTYNAKKQVQTELTGAVVSATPVAFKLPTYTGQHAIFGDEKKGRIEMYSSGNLTLSPVPYDMFVVGGGGGGGDNGRSSNGRKYGKGGSGGGGYTETVKIVVPSTEVIGIYIGSGGERQGSGNSTSISGITSATGGRAGQDSDTYLGGNGGDGGSGGAAGMGYWSDKEGYGGSDGNDGEGQSQGKTGGLGQHRTTRAFGESSGNLYAYGGYAKGSQGGGYSSRNRHGDPNTGNGGAANTVSDKAYKIGKGGSGIAIVRWDRA